MTFLYKLVLQYYTYLLFSWIKQSQKSLQPQKSLQSQKSLLSQKSLHRAKHFNLTRGHWYTGNNSTSVRLSLYPPFIHRTALMNESSESKLIAISSIIVTHTMKSYRALRVPEKESRSALSKSKSKLIGESLKTADTSFVKLTTNFSETIQLFFWFLQPFTFNNKTHEITLPPKAEYKDPREQERWKRYNWR